MSPSNDNLITDYSDQALAELGGAVGRALRDKGVHLVCAESCTGGWLGKVLTDWPGSSEWFEGGYVTYSNSAKESDLGVSANTLREEGAVSDAAVRQMAQGALDRSTAQVSVAISGIAGPSGGSDEIPVGTVWFAWSWNRLTHTALHHFSGEREAVRRRSVRLALQGILDIVARSG